jgi:hypothetical protein
VLAQREDLIGHRRPGRHRLEGFVVSRPQRPGHRPWRPSWICRARRTGRAQPPR